MEIPKLICIKEVKGPFNQSDNNFANGFNGVNEVKHPSMYIVIIDVQDKQYHLVSREHISYLLEYRGKKYLRHVNKRSVLILMEQRINLRDLIFKGRELDFEGRLERYLGLGSSDEAKQSGAVPGDSSRHDDVPGRKLFGPDVKPQEQVLGPSLDGEENCGCVVLDGV